MTEAKVYEISKWDVVRAFGRVKANHGAAGVDKQSLEDFEKDLKGNLYKIWNRMSSGSYFPPPVRTVEIPKGDGKTRPLGIPTVSDRVAQQVAKQVLEPLVEPHFHPDSYGYRPGKSALDAVGVTRKRCWRRNWVIDLDIKGFFDNLDHDLVMRAVRHHTTNPWILLYVERWLKAPAQMQDGTQVERTKGTPQGGVISPLLANLFMHYAFDTWLARNYPDVQFARYADDGVVHAKSEEQAVALLDAIRNRLSECHLEVHPEKTKLVYCRDDDRTEGHDITAFDFLGYTFRPRRAKNFRGKYFVSFLPAISQKSSKKIRQKIREWKIPRRRSAQTLEDIAALVNPSVRGWFNYYGKYYPSMVKLTLRHLERVLIKWARDKFKNLRYHKRQAYHFVGRLARKHPDLFVLWKIGVIPASGSYEPNAPRGARSVR
ncbi:MAG: group II intron reverse transcriptase/maturase [Planctomycetes bacterium]|nr:group II intron reverse transcriptase/maturase [Planctomycetota bacterium]MBA3753365.1 group II intron reverse transcriptase/maturase [Nitrospira sp.]